MHTNVAICKYCGQTQMIETSSELSDAMAADAAIAKCDCVGAIKHRALEQFKIDMEEILGAGAMDAGFAQPASDVVRNLVYSAGEAVYNGDIGAVTVRIAQYDQIRVSEAKTGGLKLSRREVRER